MDTLPIYYKDLGLHKGRSTYSLYTFQPVQYGEFVENLISMCANIRMRKNVKKNPPKMNILFNINVDFSFESILVS